MTLGCQSEAQSAILTREVVVDGVVVDVFRFLHFVGLAALIGGLAVEISKPERRINRAVIDGGLTQLVSGIVLLVLTLEDVNHFKVTVKLVILVIVLVIVFRKRRGVVPPAQFFSALGLSVVNVGVAVFW